MPVEVNPAAVQRSNVSLPGEIPLLSGGGKSADAIVAGETSRSADEHSKDAGGLPALRSGHAVRLRVLRSRWRGQGIQPSEGPNQ